MATPKQSKQTQPKVRRRPRPLHVKLALHPLSLFMLLCMGLLLTASTLFVRADSMTVNATIQAPALSDAAIITAPLDGSVSDKPSVTVEGSCPDTSYVQVFHNDVLSGTSPCTSKRFSVYSDLFAGANRLRAQAYNLTDAPGPPSPTVIVRYDPPARQLQPTNPALTGAGQPEIIIGSDGQVTVKPGSTATPLLLNGQFRYQGVALGGTLAWQLATQGGTAPYALHIDWGDGQSATSAVPTGGPVSVSHRYERAGVFIINLELSDAAGAKTHLQLFALVRDDAATGLTSRRPAPPTPIQNLQSGLHDWLWMMWPIYATLVLMALSFWLGERQEYRYLYRHKRLSNGRGA